MAARQLEALAAVIVCLAVAPAGITLVGDEILPASAYKSALSPLPPPANLPPQKVELGERLFHDRRLSGREALSCSSCP